METSADGAAAVSLNLNIQYDSSVNGAPVGFKTVVNSVVQFLEQQFVDPITITIDLGWGEINNQSMDATALGESSTHIQAFTYSQVKAALTTDAKSTSDATAIATLPATSPTGSNTFWVATAEAKALGLISSNSSVDGYVGISSSLPFDYDDSNGVSQGQYDLFGTLAHEITEVMGRFLLVGSGYDPYDLFHYSANGVRDLVGTMKGYFSIDGGKTDLADFNTNPNGDPGDWASSVGNDAFLAFSNSGVINGVSAADLTAMDILGYDPAQIVAPPPPVLAEIFWRNDNGAVAVYQMNGIQIVGSGTIAQPATSWHIAGTGDFNGDGNRDILWRNDDGTVVIYEMNGTQIVGGGTVAQPDNSWHIAGTGDFNGDGKTDILWRNDDGTVAIYEMNGTQIVASGTVSQPDNSWQIAGTGDFNGDGKSDILWRNTNGTVVIWEMNGLQIIGGGTVAQPDNTWHIAGTGDFNHDGRSDILWRNDSGAVAIYEMNGTQIVASGTVAQPDNSWQIAGTDDFNGDGKSDILWRNTNGAVVVYEMNGTQIASGGTVAQPDNTWHIAAA